MVTRVPVARGLLEWALERSGRSTDDFQSHFGAWDRWVTGRAEPTLKQVEEIARYAHLPFGVLFLTEPPAVELPIPDYRLGVEGDAREPSQDLLDVIDISIQRQAWFVDYAERNQLGTAAIRRWDHAADVTEVARGIEEELGYGVDQRVGMSRTDARNHLRRRFEAMGGLPVFTSMVGNNTHRLLSRAEFRGFTLASDVAPLIFVNTNDDTLSGQIFTFLHEYAHVVRGQSGVSDEDPTESIDSGVEGWCNAVAGEVLVPEVDLRSHFRATVDLHEELDRLAARYHCSTLVVLLRLVAAGMIPRDGFSDVYAAERDRVDEILRRQPRREGGDFYRNQPFRVGEKLSRVVLAEVAAGRASYTDAFKLLGLRNVSQLDAYGNTLGVA